MVTFSGFSIWGKNPEKSRNPGNRISGFSGFFENKKPGKTGKPGQWEPMGYLNMTLINPWKLITGDPHINNCPGYP